MQDRHRYLLKRGVLSAFSIFVVATVLFLLFRLMPGDPTLAVVEPTMTEEHRQILREQFGLDKPLYVQYGLYMENLLHGNLGRSFRKSSPVSALIGSKLANTLVLTLSSVVISYVIGILLGGLLAWYRNSNIDYFGSGFVVVTYAAPVFWVGMMSIMVFSFRLGWLPTGGMQSSRATYNGLLDLYFSVGFLKHLILPLTVMVLYGLTIPAITMRNNMIDVLNQDFIQMSRVAGLSEWSIMYRHAARNALLPVVHHAAVSIGFAMGGSVVIESVFSWPGIGRTMWQAVLTQDLPLAQGTFLVLASSIIILNFVADALSVYIDPRAGMTE